MKKYLIIFVLSLCLLLGACSKQADEQKTEPAAEATETAKDQDATPAADTQASGEAASETGQAATSEPQAENGGESAIMEIESDEDREKSYIEYYSLTDQLTPLSVSGVKAKQASGEDFYLYIGRVTCPWCRHIIPTFHKLAQEAKLTVYYLNSEDTDLRPDLKAFRDEHECPTVPSILHFKTDGSVYKLDFECDSLKLEEELSREIAK